MSSGLFSPVWPPACCLRPPIATSSGSRRYGPPLSGEEVERLSTPPAPISLARSADGRFALALRGRSTDRDHVTVIDTAYDEASGEARRPFVSRTFLAHAPGGVSGGRLPEVMSTIGVAEEETGRMYLLNPAEISGLGRAVTGELEFRQPDHYAFVTGADGDGREVLHAGHLRAGGVQVLDPATGEERAWYGGCPGLHGGVADATGTRALFGCGDGLLVVPIDPAADIPEQRIPYPADGRVASFHRGHGSVIWGSTEGAQRAVHRIDTAVETPSIERVELARRLSPRTSIRTATTPGGEYLLVLTHQGFLQIRDGGTGALLREVPMGQRFDQDFHEHTDRATAPDLAATANHVYVSLPDAGRIVTVDLTSGKVTDRMRVSGMPTRMVLLGGS